MNAPSPVTLATSNPRWAITVNGTALASTIQVVSVDAWTGVNRLPKLRLVVSDGSAADEDFPISATAALIPGVTIAVSLGYGSTLTNVFTGVIYRQGLEASLDGPSRLIVEATDKAMAMTLGRQNAIFQNVTDSTICQTLIGNAGLTAAVTSSSVTHEVIVQYYASAWDMLVTRAQAAGMVVTVANAKVTVAPPDTSQSPVLTLTYGQSLMNFQGDIDAATQFTAAAIQSYAWDPATQAVIASSTAQASVTTPGNLSSDTLAAVFNVSSYVQQTGGAMQTDELTQWSSAELLKARLAKIRGSARFQGSALIAAGGMVTLAGLGARFNGNAYVSGVHHQVTNGVWRTAIEIGLSPAWFAAAATNLAAPGASGQLPPINNLQTGVVKQIDQDPDGEYRVLLTLPLLQATGGAAVWARFGAFYASAGIGACFYPEIGDEIVVGFLNGDPRYPVVLGSLYSKLKAPPYPPVASGDAAANNTKSIMTKAKLHIDFVESTKQILISTPAQSILLDDTAKSITLKDMNGNTVTLASAGITLDSASDIKLTAKGSITLDASSAISLSAQTSLTATGQSSAKLTSSGPVQVKGVTVALNP